MFRRKIREHLAARIFLLTFLLLLGAGGLTFALIAWATPITYTAVISDRLQAQVDDLTQRLAQTDLADAGPLLDAFVRESGAEAALAAPGGAEADTGSLLVLPAEDWQVSVTVSGADNSVQTYDADTYQVQIDRADRVVTATQTGILTAPITFADQEGIYQLLVSPQLRLANQAVEKLAKELGCQFINVNDGLTDERGKLKKEFTIEGIHMYANGYQVVLDNMKKYL